MIHRELKDDTFFAVLWLRQGDEPVVIDARPSDAIALALRADCPIFVAEKVMETAKLNTTGPPEGPTAEQLRGWLEDSVTVVVHPLDYAEVARTDFRNGDTTFELRRKLAAKVFARTAAYDGAIAAHLQKEFNAAAGFQPAIFTQ